MSTQKVTIELLERENRELRLENQRLKMRLERAETEIAELELANRNLEGPSDDDLTGLDLWD